MSAPRARLSPHHARGFTLLEAIVALTIFSMCTMALYGWLAVNVNALARVDARATGVRDGRTALAMLEAVNPMAEPKGERELPGGLVVRWQGKELVPRKAGVGPAGTPLVFDLALYEMDVSVLRAGREVNHFVVRRAGWETTRSMQDAEL